METTTIWVNPVGIHGYSPFPGFTPPLGGEDRSWLHLAGLDCCA